MFYFPIIYPEVGILRFLEIHPHFLLNFLSQWMEDTTAYGDDLPILF